MPYFLTKNTEQLQDEFHRLKGTGKTYGIPEVTELATIMENFYKSDPNLAMEHTPKAVEILEDIIKQVKNPSDYALSKDERFSKLKAVVINFEILWRHKWH